MMESVGSRMSDEGAVLRGTVSMNILIVDDEPSIRETCAEVARQAGMKAIAVASAEEALEVLENSAVDIVLTDLMLQQTNGLDLLRRVHDTSPTLPVIVLTQYGTIDSAVAATRLGAVDYVTKPFRIEELRSRLERAARAVELQQENYLLREQLRTRPGFGGLIGVSERMQRVYKIVQKVSLHEYPVLILGESGTVFLDEIGDMPVDLQAKLLRALQEREVKPVGATERRRIDVRIIAATNRDLDSAIKTGAFRQDLYFRLNVVQVKLPPLRDRKSDIPLLVTSFLEKFSASQQTSRDISEDAMRQLIAYDWPGNVRELENAIERAVALGSGPIVHVGDLPSSLQYRTTERLPERNELVPLDELERRAILRTLRETAGDKLQAARILGIGKTTLYRKLKQYNLDAETSVQQA